MAVPYPIAEKRLAPIALAAGGHPSSLTAHKLLTIVTACHFFNIGISANDSPKFLERESNGGFSQPLNRGDAEAATSSRRLQARHGGATIPRRFAFGGWPKFNCRSHGACTMKVTPLGDKVVIKRLRPEDKTAGGIVLPDSAKDRPQQGRVLSVGDGRLLANGNRLRPQVSEGDRIVFSGYSGAEVDVDGDELLILREEDILAVVD
jgi:chaperonin GroES